MRKLIIAKIMNSCELQVRLSREARISLSVLAKPYVRFTECNSNIHFANIGEWRNSVFPMKECGTLHFFHGDNLIFSDKSITHLQNELRKYDYFEPDRWSVGIRFYSDPFRTFLPPY